MMKNLFSAVAVILLAVPVVKAAERSTIQLDSGAVPTAKPNYHRSALTDVDGNDLAVDELLKIAFNEEESLRVAAVQVMGDMGTARARAALGIVLYGNSMSTVRAEAAEQLGNLGDGESVFALALALETERDSEVRDVISANVERNLPSENDAPGVAVARAN